MSFIKSQFGRPRGFLGRLAEQIMIRQNRERNNWAVTLLDIQRGDRVLEVGFGPGLTIRQISEMVVDGFVAGIDHSELMLAQARQRNAAAIREERVDLKCGSVLDLPYGDASFDKVFAINVLHHLSDQAGALKQLHRVLKPGGLVAITEQPRSAKTEGMVQEVGKEIVAQLTAAGFKAARFESKAMKPAASVCALGIK